MPSPKLKKKEGLPVEADYKNLPTEQLAEILKNELTTEELVEAMTMDPLVYSAFDQDRSPEGAGGESPSSSSSGAVAGSGSKSSSKSSSQSSPSSLKTPPSALKYLAKFDPEKCRTKETGKYSLDAMRTVLIKMGYREQVEQYKTFPRKAQRVNLCSLLKRLKKEKRGGYSKTPSSVVLKSQGSSTRSSSTKSSSKSSSDKKRAGKTIIAALKRKILMKKLKKRTDQKKQLAKKEKMRKKAALVPSPPPSPPKKAAKKAAKKPAKKPVKKSPTPSSSSSSSSGEKKKRILTVWTKILVKGLSKDKKFCDIVTANKMYELIGKKTGFSKAELKKYKEPLMKIASKECAKVAPKKSPTPSSSSSSPSSRSSSSTKSSSKSTPRTKVMRKYREASNNFDKYKRPELVIMARSIGAVHSGKKKAEIIVNLKTKLNLR